MPEADWSRPHWTRGEATALLVYFVFGEFPAEPKLDLGAYASEGLPPGMVMRRIPRAMLAHWDGHPLRGTLGETLRQADPAAFNAARTAPECMLLRGELPDSASLAYLRNALGIVSVLLDAGGVAVVDPQTLAILSRTAWHARYADGAGALPRNHVLIACRDDEHGAAWIKTRGMRKFARPDVSIRRVPRADAERAGEVAARLVELEARGMRFGESSTLDVSGVAPGIRVTRAGTLDDPGFNNVRLELVWPTSEA